MASWIRKLFFVLLAIGLAGCGEYHETHVKVYNLYFHTSSAKIQQEARRLIATYNRDVGMPVLAYASNIEDANSNVVFRYGLNATENKLGFGRWETTTYQEPDYRRVEGRTLERVVVHSMELEFDQTIFEEYAGRPTWDADWKMLYLLFCHEVGHGLQMGHQEQDNNDVMYPRVGRNDSVRFDRYFDQVRLFMSAG